jgi:hypothetical protein
LATTGAVLAEALAKGDQSVTLERRPARDEVVVFSPSAGAEDDAVRPRQTYALVELQGRFDVV